MMTADCNTADYASYMTTATAFVRTIEQERASKEAKETGSRLNAVLAICKLLSKSTPEDFPPQVAKETHPVIELIIVAIEKFKADYRDKGHKSLVHKCDQILNALRPVEAMVDVLSSKKLTKAVDEYSSAKSKGEKINTVTWQRGLTV